MTIAKHALLNDLFVSDDVPVGQLIHSGLLTCPPETCLSEAARLMQQAHVSCILIQDPETQALVGIWSEGDARRLDFTDRQLISRPIGDFMSHPVRSVPASWSLNQVGMKLKREGVRRLLVIQDEDQRPLGIVTQTDVVRQQGLEHYLYMREVGSAIRQPPLVLDARMPVAEAVHTLQESNSEAAIVAYPQDLHHPWGIITERDLIRLLADAQNYVCLGDIATHQLLSVEPDTSLIAAVNILREKKFRHLGVIGPQGQPIGLLSLGDILASVEYAYVNRLREALSARDSALKASMEHLRLAQKVIEVSLDGIIITDARGIIESVNPSFTELTGYTAEEVIGKTPKVLSSGRHQSNFYQNMWQALKQQGYWQGEIWNKRKNGDIFPEWLTITAIRDEKEQIIQYAAIFADISDRKRKEEKIHNLAYFDELTGLANRRLLNDRLQQALSQARKHEAMLAVLFLDLDLFKRINDSLGHASGDQVLRRVARRLQDAVGTEDSVARLGGDEFVILVPEVEHLTDLERLSHRIIAAIHQPMQIEGQELFVSTSIGISLYPQDAQNTDDLLKNADSAMYRAKENGRNNFSFFTQQLGQETSSRLTLENALRRALHQQAFQLFYQPKIDIHQGKLKGFEALIRWNDEHLGFVSPADFIPMAEQLGLIDSLGNWVLHEACQQLKWWQKAGLDVVPIAINISARQLASPHFEASIHQALQDSKIPAYLLELELTESCFLPEHAEAIACMLHRLRQLGIKISIDDFGTGYSSLSYLKRLPLDTLKIDASFVRELPHAHDDCQIAITIIAMAKALGLNVVAEGIETYEQLTFLREQGCEQGQGYYLGRPSPANQVVTWLAQDWHTQVYDH
ncbi:PAS domain S-box-containing protein/diguanylate cyclase (GGDEF) domain-containing protein [Allopseudospirillum japonicum]|uniref:cyclic-guanylate-specific phosphodiesterase n=1 Tax=Allopseudospirillum japonicum TaxID=64971 RepID=A0A1H6THA6_9GAMM|nr:EAL domain-containing protein [Allopseudospirillum japonicum]SEI76507.1 PAS domain S-box-containing protein/diguanylate cyclase (GGDEF) domain-containing protein [Allopseudospirillum japonicum]